MILIHKPHLIDTNITLNLLEKNILHFEFINPDLFDEQISRLILLNFPKFNSSVSESNFKKLYPNTISCKEYMFQVIKPEYITDEILKEMILLDYRILYPIKNYRNINQEIFDFYISNLKFIDGSIANLLKDYEEYLNLDVLKQLIIKNKNFYEKDNHSYEHSLRCFLNNLTEKYKTFDLLKFTTEEYPDLNWSIYVFNKHIITDEQYFELLKIAAPYYIENNLEMYIKFRKKKVSNRKKLQELFPTLKIK